MNVHYRTKGFILKKIERGEADMIFVIFSEDFGKLEILAKGVRKIKAKLRGGLELFYLSEFEFIQGRAYKTLTDAVLIERFTNIRRSLLKLKIAYQVAEIADRLIKGEEKDQKIWELLNLTFRTLNQPFFSASRNLLLYYYFFWNVLSILGYKPPFTKKLVSDFKISPAITQILRRILNKDLRGLSRLKITPEQQNELKDVSHRYLNFVLDSF